MGLIYIIIVFFLLASSGCSSIEQCIYLKPIEKNNNWIVQRNKHYRGSYDYVTHYYFACDSLSSIRVSFTNRVRPILAGPPIIPIFPMWSFKTETFLISISIKTYNDTDLVTLSKEIHIKINDSLSSFPYDIILDNSQKKWKEESHKSICDNQSKTNNYLRILYRYKVNPDKINNITISFDQAINKKLSSNYKSLNLKRGNRLHYNALFFPASYENH